MVSRTGRVEYAAGAAFHAETRTLSADRFKMNDMTCGVGGAEDEDEGGGGGGGGGEAAEGIGGGYAARGRRQRCEEESIRRATVAGEETSAAEEEEGSRKAHEYVALLSPGGELGFDPQLVVDMATGALSAPVLRAGHVAADRLTLPSAVTKTAFEDEDGSNRTNNGPHHPHYVPLVSPHDGELRHSEGLTFDETTGTIRARHYTMLNMQCAEGDVFCENTGMGWSRTNP